MLSPNFSNLSKQFPQFGQVQLIFSVAVCVIFFGICFSSAFLQARYNSSAAGLCTLQMLLYMSFFSSPFKLRTAMRTIFPLSDIVVITTTKLSANRAFICCIAIDTSRAQKHHFAARHFLRITPGSRRERRLGIDC